MSVCLFVCLFLFSSLFIFRYVFLSVCFSVCLTIYLSVCLSIWLSGCLSVCLSSLCVCMSVPLTAHYLILASERLQELMTYPHQWVRLAGAQLLGHLLSGQDYRNVLSHNFSCPAFGNNPRLKVLVYFALGQPLALTHV